MLCKLLRGAGYFIFISDLKISHPLAGPIVQGVDRSRPSLMREVNEAAGTAVWCQKSPGVSHAFILPAPHFYSLQ